MRLMVLDTGGQEANLETRICCGKRYVTWSVIMQTVNLIMLIISQPGREWFGKWLLLYARYIKNTSLKGEHFELMEIFRILLPVSVTDLRGKYTLAWVW